MPVFNEMNISEAPSWVGISHYGIGRLKKGDSVESHYHDCDEFWFVVEGRGKIRTENQTYTVSPGEVVCTKMGEDHEVAEVLEEPFTIVWVEKELKGKKRTGHLHRGEE